MQAFILRAAPFDRVLYESNTARMKGNSMSGTSNAIQPVSQPVAAPAPRHFSWPLAVVLITMLLVVGGPIAYMLISWTHTIARTPGRIVDAMANAAVEAARPRIDIQKIAVTSISDLKRENKLVVYKAKLNADVTQTENYSRFGVYWGANTARVLVRDAQVQYVIDMSQLQTSDFLYNEDARVLNLYLPRPRLDQEMVAIDPAKIQTLDLRGGWARFDKQETRDHAIAELKPNLLSQATAPYIRELAAANGIESTTKILQPLADTLARDGVTIHVTYHD